MFAFLRRYDVILAPGVHPAGAAARRIDPRRELPRLQPHHGVQRGGLAGSRGALRGIGRGPPDRRSGDRGPLAGRHCAGRGICAGTVFRRVEGASPEGSSNRSLTFAAPQSQAAEPGRERERAAASVIIRIAISDAHVRLYGADYQWVKVPRHKPSKPEPPFVLSLEAACTGVQTSTAPGRKLDCGPSGNAAPPSLASQHYPKPILSIPACRSTLFCRSNVPISLKNDTPAEISPPQLVNRRPSNVRAAFLLYALTGFTGLLAEQGFEKYVALLVGATASASAVVLFSYFLGFAVGGVAVGWLIKERRIARPLLAYGFIELAVGVSCVVFTYSFHGLVEALAPLQNMFGSTALRFEARFLCGCILVLPTAALMGASFPLIASALDTGDPAGKRRWAQAYTANLGGALLAAGTGPLIVMPALGLRGSLWLCFAITSAVCAATVALRSAPQILSSTGKTTGHPRGLRGVRLLLAAGFASGAVFFALEVVLDPLSGRGHRLQYLCILVDAHGRPSGLVNRRMASEPHAAARFNYQARAPVPVRHTCADAPTLLLDRAPVFFSFGPPAALAGSFYFAELYKLAVACLLLAPAATVLGLIYPTLLASPRFEGKATRICPVT